jgi:hypothetical protein
LKTIGIVALATVAALVLGFGARLSTPTAHAEVEGSVAIGCEFLGDAIDGAVDNASSLADACGDGIDATDVANLANALDEDDVLEASDFDDLDLDANQVQDDGASVSDELLLFAFVDNDGVVTFDAETGLDIAVLVDTNGAASADGDANPETCAGVDDLDCDAAILNDGDGVAVAIASENDAQGEPGDEIDVDIFQADDTGQVSTQTLNVVGDPDGITLDVLKNPIQESGDDDAVDECHENSDVTDAGQLADINRTFLKATVTDDDDRELTRIVVDFDIDDEDIASFDDDSDDPSPDSSPEPDAMTGETVDAGAAGIGSFVVICGGTEAGTITVTATEDVNDNDADAEVDVVGEPANVALTASPAAIDCDGAATATVSATVTDADGNNVADGTDVNFSVVALGTANPINDDTAAGVASSSITPLSGAVAGVTVIVSAGDAQASIRIDCNTPAAATATPGGAATPTRPGGVLPPDTGSGGLAGQDSAGFPMWMIAALALGSLALVGGGLVTRRAGK